MLMTIFVDRKMGAYLISSRRLGLHFKNQSTIFVECNWKKEDC